MRIALTALVATGPAHKVGNTWVVCVARRDGVPVLANTCVTFRTKREAAAFAAEA